MTQSFTGLGVFAGEEIRTRPLTFAGVEAIDFRIWNTKTSKPTGCGILIDVRSIPQIVEALTSAYGQLQAENVKQASFGKRGSNGL
ncbi:MAG TPA: hypothetical protein HPQ04_08205 [Rhodospirillaceae bacterium]|nr:hypothetical protein [Rhodospirillaceae bacterium]